MADGYPIMGCGEIFRDKTDGYGLYILTGSTIVDNSKINHRCVGRIHMLMSLYESGDSNDKISLIDLFNDKDVKINRITSDLSLSEFNGTVKNLTGFP